MKRWLLLLVAVGVLGLWIPAGASAHAVITSTAPARDARLDSAPTRVEAAFNEAVSSGFGALRVFDSDGREVQDGATVHPASAANRISVPLRNETPDGAYTATYRVISADGHVVSGGWGFIVGKGQASSTPAVAELVAGRQAPPVTGILLGIARGFQFAAIAVFLGAFFVLLATWPRARTRAGEPHSDEWDSALLTRIRRIAAMGAAAGFVSAAAGVALSGAQTAGFGPERALEGSLLNESLATRFGLLWAIAAGLWACCLVLSLLTTRPGRAPWLAWTPVIAGAPIVLLPALSGHAAQQSPAAVMVGANVVHVAAMAVWVGGVAALLLAALPTATRLKPASAIRMRAALVRTFSPAATWAVALVLLTGILQSYVEVATPGNLFTTAFGRVVLVKTALLVAIVALAAYQRRRLFPRLDGIASGARPAEGAAVILRRFLAGEVFLMAAALAATAALSGMAPATATPAGPVYRETAIGPLEMQLNLDPAMTGVNQTHIYLTSARNGAQFDGAREVSIELSMPERNLGPIRATALKAGPGHFIAPASVPVAGDWRLTVVVRVSDFDEYRSDLGVPIG